MEILCWAVTIALMMGGLVGTVVPFVPGTIMIWAGAIFNYFTLHSVGWPTLVALTLLMALSLALDIVSGAVGAKHFGATRWGALGCILGAIVGIFFGLPGLFLGPVAGALVGELVIGRGLAAAGKASWGTFLGTTAGTIGKLVLGFAMIGWFTVAALLR